METNVNYTLVGGFVIFLLICIILGIIWLSSGFSVEQYSTYKVYMKESVSGLSLDAPVEYNGVNVGSVSSVEINHKNPQLVELLLDIKTTTPITKGTRAKLGMRVLSGVAYILLEDRGTDMSQLEALPGQAYPVINTAPSFFLRLDTAITQLNESLRTTSRSLQALLNNKNLQSIQEILANTAKASLQLPAFLQSSKDVMSSLESKTIPAANQAAVKLNVLMQDLAGVTKEIKQNPAILIRGKAPEPLGPGEK